MRVKQGRRAYFELGEGVNKRTPEAPRCRGFWRNPPLENFKILKLGKATFIIHFFLLESRGSEAPPVPVKEALYSFFVVVKKAKNCLFHFGS